MHHTKARSSRPRPGFLTRDAVALLIALLPYSWPVQFCNVTEQENGGIVESTQLDEYVGLGINILDGVGSGSACRRCQVGSLSLGVQSESAYTYVYVSR
ncbi:hypothetical protein BGX38DRAFT_802409 [Terfezia claveryi]|nr:hypothetical protein BGX38DRAFT_802409 [Terfezia claveryi]